MSAAQFAADHFIELVVGGVIVLVGLCTFFCVCITAVVCACRCTRKIVINSDTTPIIAEYGNEDSNINETQLVYQSQNDTLAKPEPDSQQKDDGPTTTQPDSSVEQGEEQRDELPTTTCSDTEEDYSVIKLDQISPSQQAEYIMLELDEAGSAPNATAAEYAEIDKSTAPVLSIEDKPPEYTNL